MVKFLWKMLEARIDARITSRILLFHEAMVERGQIKPIQACSTQSEN